MPKTPLLIVHHLHERYRESLESRSDAFEIDSFDFRDPIPFESHPAEMLLCWKTPPGLFERLPRLSWISALAAGVDHILADLPPQRDVLITRARATMPRFIAEYCLQHMLNRVRNYGVVVEQRRAKQWRYVKSDLLNRRTVGVLGLGSIGTEVAALARKLGMTVLGAKRSPQATLEQRAACDELFTGDDWRNMLPRCDFLVLTLPETARTRGMIGADELTAMKESAVLINVARGSIVDEKALIDALHNKTIAGAALDVFEEEPLPPENPLWRMENAVITPHCAGPSEVDAIIEEFLENCERWRAGKQPGLIVDRERGY